MLLNQLDNQSEILEWLSERNQHIPREDLAYLLETHAFPDNHESLPSNNRTPDNSRSILKK